MSISVMGNESTRLCIDTGSVGYFGLSALYVLGTSHKIHSLSCILSECVLVNGLG